MELKNKIVLVTGSSKGLGLVMVKQLLDQGAQVFGWSRSGTPLTHPSFTDQRVDVGEEQQVIKAFHEIVAAKGTLDVVINNAGFGDYKELVDMDSEVIRQMFDTNVLGIFYTTKCAVPLMKKQKSGHIVNISSIAGLMGIEKLSVYNATKFAVKGLSESLFKELRPLGIKVTCVYPGSIETEFFNDIEGLAPSATMLKAEDVSDSILYCLKSEATFHPINLEIRPFNVPK